MKTTRLLLPLLTFCFSLCIAGEAAASTGAVSGQILNIVTGEYVRNAQVRIVQTGASTTSETGGFYQITHLPAGEVTVEVTYAGHPTTRANVTVVAGQTATLDITLREEGVAAAGTKDDIVTLERFVVAGEREGQARVIMEQRAAMNITQHVASDLFGEDTEGNIGEFMRNLAGVQLNTSEGEISNVSIGGFGAAYVAVTVDGVSAATADATDANSRSANFRSISLNSIDGLEIARTVSADMDANAPAGTINLRSKRAFDRKGQRIVVGGQLTMSSEAMTLNKERGPDDGDKIFKIRPGGSFEYSNAFTKDFGILLNVSESNIYSEDSYTYANYNRDTTPTDLRHEVPTSMNFRKTNRLNRRFASTMTVDWRATRRLTLSLTGMFNYSRLQGLRRVVTVNTGTRALVQGEDPTREFYTIDSSSSIRVAPEAVSRLSQNFSVTPRFEYRLGDLKLEGVFSYSEAKAWYDPLGRDGLLRSAGTLIASQALYSVTRGPGLTDADYKVVQTGGPDVSDAESFSFPNVTLADTRRADTKKRIAKLDATYITRFLLPIKWKAGFKMENVKWHYQNSNVANTAAYTGPLSLSDFASDYTWDSNISGMSVTSLSGGSIFMPDLYALGRRYMEHPEEFTREVSAANYYTAYVTNDRNFEEDVNAGYIMASAGYGRFTFQAGVRLEDTTTKIMEVDPYTPEETRAQGYHVGDDGYALTVEGVHWQFLSRPRVANKESYHNFFPSASVKYQITPNLDFVVSAYKSIRRPGYYDATGVFRVSDTTNKVFYPNHDLKPEKGETIAARLAYYFKRAGQLSVSVYQTELKNMINTSEVTAEQAGFDESHPRYDPAYMGYIFETKTNMGSPVKVRSLEISYSQNLGFLGKAFRRTRVHFNYTRAYAEVLKTMLAPHQVSTGINYGYRNFTLWSNLNWTDDFPISDTGYSYRYHRTQIDAGTSWRFRSGYILGLTARNLTGAPHIHMQKVPPGGAVMRDYVVNSVTITCSLKKAF